MDITHNKKVNNIKKLADLMDKERENKWISKAKNASDMRTLIKTIEIKNELTASDRNETIFDKISLRDKEKYELDKLLFSQREKHRREEDEISELSRSQD